MQAQGSAKPLSYKSMLLIEVMEILTTARTGDIHQRVSSTLNLKILP